MDNSGKVIWAKHTEIQQANLKNLTDVEVKDGERLPLAVKDMGSCEIYPQTISHNPNGRYLGQIFMNVQYIQVIQCAMFNRVADISAAFTCKCTVGYFKRRWTSWK